MTVPASYKQFEPAIGKGVTSREVKALLATLGWKKAVKLARGASETELAFDEVGIRLLFVVPEDAPSVATKNLVLHEVQFRPPYAGVLPKKLAFTDDLMDVQGKLGPPGYSSRIVPRKTWYGKTANISIELDATKKRGPRTIAAIYYG